MDLKKWARNLPVSLKLLYGYMFTFLVSILLFSLTLYFYFSATVSNNVEAELSNSTQTIKKAVVEAVDDSIVNHLKVITEKNLQILIGIYQKDMKEKDAKALAREIFLSQSVGETGLLYSVDSQGIIQAHSDKELIGKNLSSYHFIKQQKKKKQGYLEYEWKDDDGGGLRTRALYMSYFGPWDWIVTASSHKDEFGSYITAKDLRDSILSHQFGKTGYSFVMDSKGTLLIHPKLEGSNAYEIVGEENKKDIEEMVKGRRGKTTLHWQNPGEPSARKKIVYYDYIEELDWIISSAAYADEIYHPLRTFKILIFILILLMAVAVAWMTWLVSGAITKPLKYLTVGLRAAKHGDFSKRLYPKSNDELGGLESYFNNVMAQLQESSTRMNESEKNFRSIFENSVEGIFQFDLEGHVIHVNPSFVAMLGYASSQAILEEGLNFQKQMLVKKELWGDFLELIISDGTVKGLELQIHKKSGMVIWCLLNARGVYKQGSDELIRVEGFISDINEKKIAQEGQKKVLEDLEIRVADRTVELSGRIAELEQRNLLNRQMSEMGDMLQSCRSIDETFPVINQYFKIIFPDDECALYLHDETKQMIDRVIPLAIEGEPPPQLTNDSCWALRQGKSYVFQNMDHDLACEHVEEETDGYLCVPLIAHGVTTGLLHLAFSNNTDEGDETVYLERKKRLCTRLADHLSLALANLTLHEELKIKSIQDPLTGLANRRHMEEILQRQFYRLQRYKTPCSVIMFDVDHFKKFNDTYGHDVGDMVLQELGSYLKDNCRGEDLASRFGGEEFFIILVDSDLEQAYAKAERMRLEIEENVTIPYLSETLHITVSVGVATSPDQGRTPKELIKSADNALYKAKDNGRNRVEIAS